MVFHAFNSVGEASAGAAVAVEEFAISGGGSAVEYAVEGGVGGGNVTSKVTKGRKEKKTRWMRDCGRCIPHIPTPTKYDGEVNEKRKGRQFVSSAAGRRGWRDHV